MKIIDRVSRRAGERARHARRDDVRPAPAARPAARQGAAAADDDRQKLEALAARRHAGHCGRRPDARAVAWDSETFVRRWSSSGSRRGDLGRRQPVRHDRRNFPPYCAASARVPVPRRENRPGPLQGLVVSRRAIRRLVREGPRRRGRAPCSGATTSSTARWRAAPARKGTKAFRPPTSNRHDLLPPAGVYATTIVIDGEWCSGDHHRRAAHVRRHRSDPGSRPTCSTLDAELCYGQTLRLSFVRSASGTQDGGFPMSTR